MPRPFWRVTAEAVVAAIDAVHIMPEPPDAEAVAKFAQLREEHAVSALALAEDIGFLREDGGTYSTATPLARSMADPDQARRGAALRILLDAYEPFTRFRERLVATDSANLAAQQTALLLDLDAHHEDVQETLISLGQFCRAIKAEGGGVYRPSDDIIVHSLDSLAAGCADAGAAELRILEQIGPNAAETVNRDEVIRPLSDGLQRAVARDGRGAVVAAGNAVESFLSGVGDRRGVAVGGRHGVNAKAQALQDGGVLPRKLLNVSKYLGHVRNAADHGVDPDVGAPWDISDGTGVEYVFVACSFVRRVVGNEQGAPPEL